ncbi:MAG: carboxypeptidase-like regulatory domain-containing protein [Candidatus Thiodiazotropha sp.]
MRAHIRFILVTLLLLFLLLIAGTVSAAGSLSGRVTEYGSGVPRQGIELTLFRSEDPNSAGDDAWIPVHSVYSDINGEYLFANLEPRQYRVHIWALTDSSGRHFVEADLYNVQVFDNSETVDMDLLLHEAGFIWGYVRTASGTPIPGVTVWAHAEWFKEGPGWHDATTDETGLYRIWVLPSPGEFYVLVTRGAVLNIDTPDPTIYTAEIAPGLYQVTIQGARGPDFALTEGGCISGRVVNEQGVGVQDVEVWPHTGILEVPRVRTGWGGYYSTSLPVTDQAYAFIQTGDLDPIVLDGIKYGSGERFVGPFSITPGLPCTEAPDMVMLPSGSIEGVVTDTAGIPIVGAEIEIQGFDADGNELDVGELPFTDALGQYTLDFVPPGEYTVRALKNGWVMTTRNGVVVTSGEQTDLDLVLRRADQATAVSGQVADFLSNTCQKDSNGILLPHYLDNGYEIGNQDICQNGIVAIPSDYLYRTQEPISILALGEIDDGYTGYFLPHPTEIVGNYHLALPPGMVDGLLYSEYRTDRGEYILIKDRLQWTLAKGETLTDQDFQLLPTTDTGVLEGVINYPSEADFNPRMTVIIAFNEDHPSGSTLGDAFAWPTFAPVYRIGHLPTGRYTLRVLSQGFVDQTYEGVVVTSGATTVQDITLSTGATLSGSITNAVTGLPVAGARVEFSSNSKTGVSDTTGAYAVSGLAADDYNLLVTKPGYADFSATVSVSLPNTSYDIALDPQAGSISGQVVDVTATAINDAQVVAYNPALDSYKTGITIAGHFAIADLPAGDYVLGIHATGYSTVQYPASGTLTLNPNQTLVLSNPIMLSPTPPLFDSWSTVSESAGVKTLQVTFTTDIALLAAPIITAHGHVTTNGCNSLDWQTITAGKYLATCEVATGESLVRIDIAESSQPVIPGYPASASFSFEVADNLLSTSSTNFFNAIGGDTSIMGTQDNTQVYVPPFALVGSDTQAVKLTVKRYGNPDDAASSNSDQTVSAVYDFFFEDDAVRIDTNHRVTITLQFEKPVDMSQEAFEADLKIGYFRVSDQQWVYQNDPDSGIDNIHINWLNSTVTFDTSHFTRFAAFVPKAETIPGDYDSDGDVDRDDLSILLLDRNKTVEASACGPACDLDQDGLITALDARTLVLLCSRPRCATE